MTVHGTDHLVIAVADLQQGIANWQNVLGMSVSHRVAEPGAELHQAFFVLADGTFVELIAPGGPESALARTLSERGEGIHVVALSVDDLEKSVQQLQGQGVRLIGVGTPQVFIHPKSANGVLVQLWPKDRPHRWRDNLANGGTANDRGGADVV